MTKDYSKLEKDDLLKVIEKLESRKKYGLIWDEEKTKEQFEKESENALPVLKEVKGKEIKTDSAKPTNILIEGDNYHALSVLNYTHQGKIDVIYIDPPYNTGNKDFKYNDRWVDREDTYRHSKWLSFIIKRLRLAKKLLKDDGAIFISIDDNEQAQLKLVCNEVFGEDNFIANVIWEKKFSPQNDAKWFSDNHDYLLVYARNKELWRPNLLPRTEASNARFSNPDKDSRGDWVSADMTVKTYSKNYDYPIKTPTGKIVMPTKGRCWATPKEKVELLIKDNRIWFGKSGGNVPRVKIFRSEVQEGIVPLTIWKHSEVGHNQEARQELKNILHDALFDNPKPTRLIQRIIQLATTKDSLILDFMAGSGTTGHAVLKSNQEDNGSRQFILCTNNELNGFEKELKEKGMSDKEIQEYGICRYITYPRIEKVINGYKNLKNEKINGLGGNLKYYKTSFVKTSISRDDLKMRITRECTEMLCLREGIFDEKKIKADFRIFEQNGRIMAVYYALERDGLGQLKKNLDKMEGKKILYCFTLDPLGLDKKDFSDWQGVSVEPIPQKILDIYEQIYEY